MARLDREIQDRFMQHDRHRADLERRVTNYLEEKNL